MAGSLMNSFCDYLAVGLYTKFSALPFKASWAFCYVADLFANLAIRFSAQSIMPV